VRNEKKNAFSSSPTTRILDLILISFNLSQPFPPTSVCVSNSRVEALLNCHCNLSNLVLDLDHGLNTLVDFRFKRLAFHLKTVMSWHVDWYCMTLKLLNARPFLIIYGFEFVSGKLWQATYALRNLSLNYFYPNDVSNLHFLVHVNFSFPKPIFTHFVFPKLRCLVSTSAKPLSSHRHWFWSTEKYLYSNLTEVGSLIVSFWSHIFTSGGLNNCFC